MARFCRRCGKQLGPDGLCPGCGYRDPAPRTGPVTPASGRTAGGRNRSGGKIALIVILALLLLLVLSCLLQVLGVIDLQPADSLLGLLGLKQGGSGGKGPAGGEGPEITDYEIPEDYLLEMPDAEAYYQEHAEYYRKIPVKSAEGVRSEREVLEDYARRGFTQTPVVADCSMDGTAIDETAISDASTRRHPGYETLYCTETGEYWRILEFNGALFAFPESYNWRRINEGGDMQLVVSETDTVISYDQSTNTYFETIPREPIVVYRVEKIDSETLELLSRGDLAW